MLNIAPRRPISKSILLKQNNHFNCIQKIWPWIKFLHQIKQKQNYTIFSMLWRDHHLKVQMNGHLKFCSASSILHFKVRSAVLRVNSWLFFFPPLLYSETNPPSQDYCYSTLQGTSVTLLCSSQPLWKSILDLYLTDEAAQKTALPWYLPQCLTTQGNYTLLASKK